MKQIISSEGADTLITSHVRQGQLPWQVEKAISIAPEGEMRDMLLLSLLTNYAYALPAMRMYHGFPHHVYGPELMTMVLAPAASGKGIMNYAKQLLQGIENEHGEFIFLPANTSSAALMSYLKMLKGRGIMMATEIDTLSKALGSTTGGFSDVLRCMFEHETISKLRKNQEELIEIPDPHFAVLISGTYNQLKVFATEIEGLWSFYPLPGISDEEGNINNYDMRKFFIIFTSLLSFSPVAIAQDSRLLSLNEAIEISLTNNPVITSAYHNKQVAIRERKAVRGLRMPQINITGNYTYLNKNIDINFNNIKQDFNSKTTEFLGTATQSGVITQQTSALIGGVLEGIGNLDWSYTIQKQNFGFIGAEITMPIYLGGKIII